MDPETQRTAAPGAATREALIASAIHLFGAQGYADTSTRAIAAHAGANIAAIAYHFGSKAGLHAACAEAIAARLGSVLEAGRGAAATPDAAVAQLEIAIRAIVRFLLLEPSGGDVAAFMLREITDPGRVLDVLYVSLIEPRHRDLCRLWSIGTGCPAESETTRLAVFAMMGQVVYFRIGRPVVRRRMGWQEIGPTEAAAVADMLVANLHASIAAARARR